MLVRNFVVAATACAAILGARWVAAQEAGTTPAEKRLPTRIALQIDWPQEPATKEPARIIAFPVYCGVSFPRGQVNDLATVRVVDDADNVVASQVEPLTRWHPDSSWRWAGLRFVGQRDRRYFVRFATPASPTPPAAPRGAGAKSAQIHVSETTDAITIDTSAARWELPKRGPLVRRAWWGETLAIEADSQTSGCLLIADQQRETADETRGEADEAPQIEIRDPHYVCVRRAGFLKTANGRRLAKYIVRLEFWSGVADVKLQHALVLTESTNDVQFSDLAVRFQPAFRGERTAWLATDREAHAAVWKSTLPNHGGAFAAQLKFPHHGQTRSEVAAGTLRDGVWQPLAAHTGVEQDKTKARAIGHWSAVASAKVGVALSMPQLVELFPKELEIGAEAITAHLWTSRGGRLLDYRPAALIDHWGRDWAKGFSGGLEALAAAKADGVSTSRTHDLWLKLFSPSNDERQTTAALSQWGKLTAQPPLAVQDPQWLRTTEALGPLHPLDEKHFPREEKFVRDFVRDYLIGAVERWGDYGFLDFGCGAHSYDNYSALPGSTTPRFYYRYAHMIYHSQVALWYAFARSGERQYVDYAAPFSRSFSNFKFSYWPSRNRPFGSKIGLSNSEETPFYWAGTESHWPSGVISGHQGDNPEVLVLQHYLTGDRWALECLKPFGERLLNAFDVSVMPNIGANSNGAQPALAAAALYRHTGDERYREFLAKWRERMVDLRTSTGVADPDYYGAWEKWPIKIRGILDDFLTTGDPTSRTAFLRGVDLFARTIPISDPGYQDHTGLFMNWAWRLTGDTRYADWIAERLQRTMFECVDADGRIRVLSPIRGAPHGGGNHKFNFIETVFFGLDAVAQTRGQRQPWIKLDAGLPLHPVEIYFAKDWHEALEFDLSYSSRFDMQVVTAALEKSRPIRDSYVGPIQMENFPNYYTQEEPGLADGYARLRIPFEAVKGEYRFQNANTIFRHTARKLVLHIPDGILLRAGSTQPPVWFCQLPAGRRGELYVNKRTTIKRGDQTIELPVGEWFSLTGSDRDELLAIHTSGITFFQTRGEIPPVLAQHDPQLFFVPQKVTEQMAARSASAAPPAIDKAAKFVEGLTGNTDQALLLTGNRELQIARGAPRAGDTSGRDFEAIDYRQGTLEFWFRPHWTTGMSTVSREQSFLTGGFWTTYLRSSASDDEDSRSANCWHFQATGQNGPLQQLLNTTPVRAGDWTHFAVAWATDEQRGWLSEIYINGKPASGYTRYKVGLGRYLETESPKYLPPRPWGIAMPTGEQIRLLGVLNATLDELRISDVARYPEPFSPPRREPFSADRHTRLLLRFDGDLKPITPSPTTTSPLPVVLKP